MTLMHYLSCRPLPVRLRAGLMWSCMSPDDVLGITGDEANQDMAYDLSLDPSEFSLQTYLRQIPAEEVRDTATEDHLALAENLLSLRGVGRG